MQKLRILNLAHTRTHFCVESLTNILHFIRVSRPDTRTRNHDVTLLVFAGNIKVATCSWLAKDLL